MRKRLHVEGRDQSGASAARDFGQRTDVERNHGRASSLRFDGNHAECFESRRHQHGVRSSEKSILGGPFDATDEPNRVAKVALPDPAEHHVAVRSIARNQQWRRVRTQNTACARIRIDERSPPF